jgi:uncharacterized membrane protein
MGRRLVIFGIVAWCVLVVSSIGLADTGGSMGGGDWGGGGGGGGYDSGGGGYSSSGDYSSSSGWSSDGGSSGGGGDPVSGVIAILASALIVYVVTRDNTPRKRAPGPAVEMDNTDVSVLRVGIDARARKFVQTELSRIAKSAKTSTAAGRAAMLREVANLLRKLHDAWVYGGAVNEPMREKRDAKRVFDRHVDDARARFREEVIRNADGAIETRAASDYRPRSDEGEGVILVTLVIAAARELFTVARIGDGDHLRRALEAVAELSPATLVAVEIIWQPAIEDDRLSSMELEAKYPPPELFAIRGALVGKTFCDYCSGPYPAELASCPHCGAPSASRRAA